MPLRPTEALFVSAIQMPCSTASSGLLVLSKTRRASSFAGLPNGHVETTSGRLVVSNPSAPTFIEPICPNAAAPAHVTINERRVRLLLSGFMLTFSPERRSISRFGFQREDASGGRGHRFSEREHWR